MPTYHASLAGIKIPDRIKRLPVDKRGFPVPRFVAIVNGEPDHRVVDSRWYGPAIRGKLCWICGEPMGRYFCSVIGCMCSVNRIISEPPSHKSCAEFAVKGCPFLSRPHAHRREAGLPEEHSEPAGVGLKRNPGVACLWISKKYPTPQRAWGGNDGLLFVLQEPTETIWYREGRLATRQEVLDAIADGMPILRELAEKDGLAAVKTLDRMHREALRYLPMAMAA